MSSSWSCEKELRTVAEELHQEAYQLEQVAELLELQREEGTQASRLAKIKSLKSWARSWLKEEK